VKKNFPRIPTEISRGPYEVYGKAVDIYNLHPNFCTEEEREKIHLGGGKVTFYYGELFQLNRPTIYPRLLPWIIWRYASDGFYFPAIDNWHEQHEACSKANYFCFGILVDRDRDGSIVNSIRFEQFRKGIADYKYIKALEEKIKTSRNRELVSQAKAFLDRLAMKISINKLDINPDEIEVLRRRMGELIEAL
jgi:hypothetical protein